MGDASTATGVTRTLVEVWNGVDWSTVPSADPSPSVDDVLYGVSCPSSTSCMAVGSTTDAGGYLQTLAEYWDGSVWSIVGTPDTGAGVPNSLGGVSCASATSCVAVGSAATTTGSVTVVESWNGSAWSLTPSPDVPGTQTNSLSGVSCPTQSECTAVGYDVDASGSEQTLVEAWNGSSWVVVSSPDTTSTSSNALNGVSCTSVSACTAVGTAYSDTGTADQTLVEAWNGSSWAIVASPDPTDADDELQGVSCTSSGCTAVGYATTDQGIEQGMVEASTDGVWAVSATPEPGVYGNSLAAVACTGVTCVATGSEETGAGLLQTLAETDAHPATLSVPSMEALLLGVRFSIAVSSSGDPSPTFTVQGAPPGSPSTLRRAHLRGRPPGSARSRSSSGRRTGWVRWPPGTCWPPCPVPW